MAVNLTGVLSDLASAIPSSSDVLQQVLLGAGASVVLAGLKTNAGLDAVDPLHIIHKDGTQTVSGGKSISAAAFAALPADAQSRVLAAGYVVAG